MNPFEFSDYREFLVAVCSQPSSLRGFQSGLARAAGCQASYFSQVLKGRVHLTEDQAIGLADSLGFNEAELEHFLLLLRLAKAGTSNLKKYLHKVIEKSVRAQLDLSERVDSNRLRVSEENKAIYFSSWIPSAVHLLTSSPINTSKKMAERLQIPISKVVTTLSFLNKMGLIESQGDKWVYKGGAIHNQKESPWQTPLQIGRRQLALRSIAVESEEAIHFSSMFTLDKKNAEDLRKLIGSFVERSHKMIHKSGSEELFCMCLDFFEVL